MPLIERLHGKVIERQNEDQGVVLGVKVLKEEGVSPITLKPDQVYVFTKWDMTAYVRAVDETHFKVEEIHGGKEKMDLDEEYMIILSKY